MTSMTVEAVKDLGLNKKEAERSKNMFALGVISWMYGRPSSRRSAGSRRSSRRSRRSPKRTSAALKTGHAFGETGRADGVRGQAGRYSLREPIVAITGNQALAYGLIAASVQSKLPLFLGSLSDHAGVRHPSRALAPQELRGSHDPGRGRDRGGRDGAWARPSPAISA